MDVSFLQKSVPSDEAAYTVYDPRRQFPSDEVQLDGGVTLTISNEEDFRAGETYTVRIELADRSGKRQKPLTGIPLSVKILGTSFRPQLYSVKTERGGLASVLATMPTFTSGRAAVLVRAVVKGDTIEVRRVIHPTE